MQCITKDLKADAFGKIYPKVFQGCWPSYFKQRYILDDLIAQPS